MRSIRRDPSGLLIVPRQGHDIRLRSFEGVTLTWSVYPKEGLGG